LDGGEEVRAYPPTDTRIYLLTAHLDCQIDWTKKEDDEIAAGLRQCQRALRDQIARNNARKTKLTGLVMDRLGYGGYEKSLEGLEKVIEGTWLKRSARKMKKQKSSQRDEQAGVKRCIEKVPLPDAVKQAMQTRRQWIEVLGKTMQAPEVQGRYTGLPEKSVYADLDDLKNDAAERTWTQTHATTAL
jgi:transcriptional adapter 3